MKNKIIVFGLLSLLIIAVLFTLNSFKSNKTNFEIEVFNTENGFGYQISHKNKLLIKQKNIPSLQNGQSFCDFIDAKKTAELVVRRLDNRKNPSVTLEDLHNLNINFNCNRP